jgi:thiol-disulfide isomerase/thioredoxin
MNSSDTMLADDANTAQGKYLEYSSNILEENKDKTIVYFFKTSWCTTCNALDRELEQSLSGFPSNLVIVKVDYVTASGASTEELDLKPRYGVTTQHTLVLVDSQGNQIKKWNNSFTLGEILTQIS